MVSSVLRRSKTVPVIQDVPRILEEVMTKWERHEGLVAPPPTPIELWTHENRTIYVEDTWGPAVPYPSVEHDDGTKNHGYVRLKDNSDAIGQLPEAQEWPELRVFLECVNAATSPIESIGCDRSFFTVQDPSDAKMKLGSYVDLIFTDAALNEHPKKLLLLAAHLVNAVDGCEKWWASVELGLQRFRHLAGANLPWGLMLRVSNYGRSEQEGRKFWPETLMRLGNAISGLPRDFGHTE